MDGCNSPTSCVAIPPPSPHDVSHVSRRKENFRTLSIPKQDYFSLLLDWAREMGCTQDHQPISNYLAFVDIEAQVRLHKLIPNLFYYLSTFYHFLVSKIKKAYSNEPFERIINSTPSKNHLSERKGKNPSKYASLAFDQDNMNEDSQSIISNIRQLVLGNLLVFVKIIHMAVFVSNLFLY